MKAILLALILLPLTIFAQQKELYPKVVLINAKLDCSGRMTDSAVLKTLGRPDSTVRSAADCGTYFDAQDSLVYYRTVVLEKNMDTFALRQIVFGANSSVFVEFGPVKLNAATTIEDVTSIYKGNGNLEANEINDQISGRQVRILSIYPTADMARSRDESMLWNLIFYHGKLIRLELWIAC
jgi:hypothetical protein